MLEFWRLQIDCNEEFLKNPNTLGVALKVCNLGLLQIARGPLSAVRWVTMHAALMNCRRVMTLLASLNVRQTLWLVRQNPNTLGVALKVCNLGLLQIARLEFKIILIPILKNNLVVLYLL